MASVAAPAFASVTPRREGESPNGDAPRVHAVIVTFEPDLRDLAALLHSLAPQVHAIEVVDNGSTRDPSEVLGTVANTSIELTRLPSNFGIAYAQNIGMLRALHGGADFVLLSDQDSQAEPDAVRLLLEAYRNAEAEPGSAPVAAVGPATVDQRTGALSFFWRTGEVPWRWRPGPSCADVASVEFLIASGTLIPAHVLRALGGMRSEYFIDHVDTEWSFRARHAGFRLLGSAAARLQHRLGDKVHKIWLGRVRHVAHHSPLRDYYMFRNTLLLLRHRWIPAYWRRHLMGRLLQFAAFFLIFGDQRLHRARLMLRALRDGWACRSGKLQSDGTLLSLPRTALDPNPDAQA
jgi:rhamnosyltransferase